MLTVDKAYLDTGALIDTAVENAANDYVIDEPKLHRRYYSMCHTCRTTL